MRFILAAFAFLFLNTSYASEDLGLLFFGDFGTGSQQQYKVASGMKMFCKAQTCDLAITVGDNFYPAGVKSVNDPAWKTKWFDLYHELGIVFHPALGNHDYAGNWKAQIEYSKQEPLWDFPARYYTFDSGPVSFFALDTQEFDSTQQKWLKDNLRRSRKPWKIAYGHHPIYSYGQHGDTPEMKTELLPILKGHADFYLAGHDHDKQVLEVEGEPVFVISGAASQLRKVKKGSKSLFAKESFGFSHLQFKGDQATLRMLTANGEVEYEKVVRTRARALSSGE